MEMVLLLLVILLMIKQVLLHFDIHFLVVIFVIARIRLGHYFRKRLDVSMCSLVFALILWMGGLILRGALPFANGV